MFNHVKHGLTLPDLHCDTTPTGRFYYPPTGEKYPSVTTVLSIMEKDGLEKWKKSVGEEQAARIVTQAGIRGTEAHLIAEEYIDNKPDYAVGKMPINMFTFNQIKPLLDKHLDNIWFQEAPLYSHFIRVAGRVDLVAEWNGKLSIIDFKTSRKPKKREWITNYFLQTAFYAAAFYERTGVPIKQSVILIATDEGTTQEFVEQTYPWLEDFIKIRNKYKTLKGF
jgi:hypothetical protein